MEDSTTPRISPQLILGLGILVLGVLFLLDNLGLIRSHDYMRFWPVALIALGVAKIVDSRNIPIAGIALAVIGTPLLLSNLHVLQFRIRHLFPVVLVLIGASLVVRALGRSSGGPFQSSDSMIQSFAVMGGVVRSSNSQDFRGGELTAVMGGCELDLRAASIATGEAVIDTFAFWGGIEIKVPESWTVISRGWALMGGFEDKTRPPKHGDAPAQRLVIKGMAVMGGVEIKN